MTGDLSGTTTLVVGASRGLGRGIAAALVEAGAPVVAVARTTPDVAGAAAAEAADATDAVGARRLLDRYDPLAVVLVAGATPVMRPLQDQTWETFSVNWDADVRIAFSWLGEILRRPLRPGARVVVVSSGAGTRGRRLPSVSSPATPRTRRTGPASASPSPQYCRGSPH
jgi:NAD(P)-dependent dehydrogenase (short-subunit alcohol dehydrogenase family)